MKGRLRDWRRLLRILTRRRVDLVRDKFAAVDYVRAGTRAVLGCDVVELVELVEALLFLFGNWSYSFRYSLLVAFFVSPLLLLLHHSLCQC